MHPMLMLSSETDGLIYINGEFSGEIRPDAPVFRPIQAYGAVYLEFKPLQEYMLPLYSRIAFSKGAPVPESIAAARGVYAIQWPFGITEIELSPERIYTDPPARVKIVSEHTSLVMVSGRGETRLESEDGENAFSIPLPSGAKKPRISEADGILYASGDTERGEKYLTAFVFGAKSPLLSVVGCEITSLGAGRFIVTEEIGDLAGHIRKSEYALKGGVFQAEESAIYQHPAGSFQAAAPAFLAMHALECMQLKLFDETEECFAPGTAMDESAKEIAEATSASAIFRFSPPDGRNAVAAFQMLHPSFARALPIYYSCEMLSGAWKLTDMRAD